MMLQIKFLTYLFTYILLTTSWLCSVRGFEPNQAINLFYFFIKQQQHILKSMMTN
jgi:hypothetical protein